MTARHWLAAALRRAAEKLNPCPPTVTVTLGPRGEVTATTDASDPHAAQRLRAVYDAFTTTRAETAGNAFTTTTRAATAGNEQL